MLSQRGLASGAVYTIGQPAVLSALLVNDVNDTVAITSATVSASVKVERDVSAQVTIGNYQLIGQTTGADGYVQYKYSARATNNGAALTGVQGRGSYTGGSFYAGQIVSFGSITAGATASGLDTFTVALPSGVSFSTNALSWKATAVSTAVAVSMTDSGPNDAQVGDGIYTGTYTPSEAGKHIVALTASGSSNGAAFSRTASFEFEVISSAVRLGRSRVKDWTETAMPFRHFPTTMRLK